MKTIKNRKSGKQSDSETDNEDSDGEGTGTQEVKLSSKTSFLSRLKSTRGKKKPVVRFNKEALNRDIGTDKSSLFHGRSVLSEIHDGAAKEVAASANDGLKKVTSYYDQSGNLLYQKQKDIESPLPTDGPSFHIKPRPSLADGDVLQDDPQKKFAATKVRFEDDVNNTFNEIFQSLPRM